MLHIGILQFSLSIPWAQSLKEKRGVVRSLKDRMRRKFNISIAEIEDLDTVTVATLGAVIAGNDVSYLNGALDKLLDAVRDFPDAELTDSSLEIL